MSTSDDQMAALLRALGREIKAERTRIEMSQDTLAELTGVSKRQIGKIERGERGQFVEVWKLADALGLRLSGMVAAAEDRTAERRSS